MATAARCWPSILCWLVRARGALECRLRCSRNNSSGHTMANSIALATCHSVPSAAVAQAQVIAGVVVITAADTQCNAGLHRHSPLGQSQCHRHSYNTSTSSSSSGSASSSGTHNNPIVEAKAFVGPSLSMIARVPGSRTWSANCLLDGAAVQCWQCCGVNCGSGGGAIVQRLCSSCWPMSAPLALLLCPAIAPL